MIEDKYKVENYQHKSKILRENGWQTYYHYDNWIKTEWLESGNKVEMMGRPTDYVYRYIMGI